MVKQKYQKLDTFESNGIVTMPLRGHTKDAVIVDWPNLKRSQKALLTQNYGVLCGKISNLTVIDIDHQLLPDAITLPLLWLGLAVNLPELFTTTEASLAGAMAGYGILWGVYQGFRLLTGKEGMGYGDFKLLAALGAWMGWQSLPAIILLSSVVGAVLGIAILTLRREGRDTTIPFGPYLAAAGWLYLMWGTDMERIYLRVSGLA